MSAARRSRVSALTGLWPAVALGAAGLAVWMAVLAGMVWSTWPEADRATARALLAPRTALFVMGWLGGAALIAAGLHRLWQRHVAPPAQMAEQAQALAAEPSRTLAADAPAPYLPAPDAPALNALASAFNTLLARCAAHRADLHAQVQEASARVAHERNRLAALLAQMAQSVVVCNLEGRILLYNPRARLQLRTLSHAPGLAGGAEVVGIGRSIHDVFDPEQVRHALARVQARVACGDTRATAQFVTTTHGGRLLRAQLVPVIERSAEAVAAGVADTEAAAGALAAARATAPLTCTGYLLTLEDVTRDFDAAAERDRWLAEATGASAAAVHGLLQALQALAPAGSAAASVHWHTAQTHADVLRAQVAALARHAAEGLLTRWPLEDMLAADLLAAAEHQLAVVQPEQHRVRIAADPAPPALWLRVDSYLLLQALASLAARLVDAMPLRFIGLRLQAAEGEPRVAHLDLFWDGLPLSTQTVMTWELEPVGAGGPHAMLTLRDVLDRHRGSLEYGRDRIRHEAFLRFALPQAEPDATLAASLDEALAPAVLHGGRPEFYDFDLFQTAPHHGALDEQALAALTYTVFDTETTGLNPAQGDQILQIGAARIVNGRLLRQESWEQLIDPGCRISAANSRIHGITDDMVRGQPRIHEVLPAFHAFAQGTVLVAHNAAFDMKFLQMQKQATGIAFEQPVLDTLLLAAVAQPMQDSHSLDALVQRFGIVLEGHRHTALADAIATAEVLLRLIPLLDAQGIHTLGQAREAAQKTYLARLAY